MRDSEFIRTKVPMTKEEIRAISLDKLQLHRAKRMLDVGSGTGSVTIQAAHTYPNLEVVAVERNPDAVALTRQNIEHFQCHNVTFHEGLAPIELEGTFDAIFVGGTGGNMQEIFDWCHQLLEDGGRLVLNFILMENALEAAQIAEEMNWEDVEVVSIQASRFTGLGKGHYFKPQNPTIIVSCQKSENKE
ncbi:decarboxylating cobalt-precorrin-6B (C(15))-methyltransferase [Streptococcus merionis]|uniref:Cobalt-precorrin-6Y C(15)-methyltransferase n=1 Tax=Streptococcus merionis TaxID=400065 RepID=A0A239SPE3_9STRE|nr:decarboxylating cobalt-precorrin-6B (C(15))-methyltransferase [Streptococcus merionis]SNU86738.1 cobalt-precorrin-6Y C(15)-methyltransferase [Streptococcus merionis]